MLGEISLEDEEDLKKYAPVSPDWAAVINEGLDGALRLISLVAKMRTQDEPLDKIGLAVYEKAWLLRYEVEQKIEGH